MTFFCSFSSLDELTAKDWRDYNKVRAAVLAVGKFSAFDANTPMQCRQLTRLCQDPALVVDSVSCRYPWTLVRRRLTPANFSTSPDGRRMAETENTGSGRRPDQQVPGSENSSQKQHPTDGYQAQ